MSQNSIQDRVIALVAHQLSLKESDLKPESNLVEDLGADSLDVVELVLEMEEEFDLQIPDDELKNLKSIQNIVSYIEKQVV